MRLLSVPDAVYPTAASPVDEAVGTVSVAAGASTAVSEALSAEETGILLQLLVMHAPGSKIRLFQLYRVWVALGNLGHWPSWIYKSH